MIERASASNLLSILVLLVIAAFAFAPGFTRLPPMDRDEPRFAQASKQMLESGDYISIRFQGEARLKKPVGIYWLQTAAVAAGERFGVHDALSTIWLYRIPSLIAAFGAVLLTWWTALPLISRRGALLAGAMMACCVLLGVEARLAKTDATQLLTVMAMVGVLARLFIASREVESPAIGLWLWAVFWLGMVASILVKGPIGLMLIALTIAVLVIVTGEFRWLKGLHWFWGVVFTLVLALPWFIAIMIQTKGSFLEQSVGQDMLSKVAGAQESHGGKPGTYLAVFWATFWPFAPLAALAAPFAWRNRRTPAVLFALAWLVPFWLVFEFFPTKLPHYVLPVYPAIAILIAAAIDRDELATALWARIVALLIPLLSLALATTAIAAIWHFQKEIAWLALLLGVVGVGAAVLAWLRLGERRAIEAVFCCVLAAISLYWGVYEGAIPKLQAIALSPRLAAAARDPNCSHVEAATVGFREPSLVFLAGTDLLMPSPEGAADFIGQGACRVAFVDVKAEPAFLARLQAVGTKANVVARVDGININGGKKLDIGVYRTP